MSSLPPLSGGPGAGLGNLAQAAREKHLKQARSTLIIIGILTAAINGFQLSTVESEVQKLVQIQQIPPDAAATVIGVARLILGGTVGLGILFVVLGLLVKKFPVPATVLGLVLYVAAAAGFALLDPIAGSGRDLQDHHHRRPHEGRAGGDRLSA